MTQFEQTDRVIGSAAAWVKKNQTALIAIGGFAFAYLLLSRKESKSGKSLAGYGWYEPRMFSAWWPGRDGYSGCDGCGVLARWGWHPEARWGWHSAPRWGWNNFYCDGYDGVSDDGGNESDMVGDVGDWVHWYPPVSEGGFYGLIDDLRRAGVTCSDDRIARCSWRGARFSVVHDVEGGVRVHITDTGTIGNLGVWALVDPILTKK